MHGPSVLLDEDYTLINKEAIVIEHDHPMQHTNICESSKQS